MAGAGAAQQLVGVRVGEHGGVDAKLAHCIGDDGGLVMAQQHGVGLGRGADALHQDEARKLVAGFAEEGVADRGSVKVVATAFPLRLEDEVLWRVQCSRADRGIERVHRQIGDSLG